jgi:hypothetical protein
MVQFINEYRPRTFSEKVMPAVTESIKSGYQGYQQGQAQQQAMQKLAQENDAIKRETGIDMSGITDPNQRKAYFTEQLQGIREQKNKGLDFQNDIEMQKQKYGFEKELMEGKQKQPSKIDNDTKKNVATYTQGLDTLNRMRQLRSKGNLGRGSSIIGAFGGETAKDRGEYEQLGKSLISLASTIPIRNQMEFQTLSEKLYDPSITDAEAEGTINAMQRILEGNLSQYEDDEEPVEKPKAKTKSPKERPPLSSFQR